MKKLVILMALVIFTAPLTAPLASGSSWLLNKARMQKTWTKWQKQESEYWKKFDAEMKLSEQKMDGVSTAPVTNRERCSRSE